MNRELCICAEPEGCILKNGELIFYYVGYFSQNIIHAIGDAVRARLENGETPGAVRRRMFSIFVEMAQNIVHYSSEQLPGGHDPGAEIRAGSVCICREDAHYHIICRNPVTSEWAERLRHVLEDLRQMSRDEIRQAYRRQMREGEPEENSKGAGLGLLTIARDSEGPIDFRLEPGSAGDLIFTLKATL
ncbi:SiaB family protein kinase [Ectothiorhodospira mobilis]|uniref:SiaB family protein kinase n=1 Tax=Ectothiorhodospira mobilis TaxID=195064 RepID=UPI001EE7EC16|nr:SiaB family protein kinase [Ectothiorhodospira mobilis]MCG5536332.1 SiaB family protein kinase [Ectothiorhodospira mobilis]